MNVNVNEPITLTFSDLITAEPLELYGLGDAPLAPRRLAALWSVVNYRYENLLPTTTHTDMGPWELCKALCGAPGYETLAYAVAGRLWEMGVERIHPRTR